MQHPRPAVSKHAPGNKRIKARASELQSPRPHQTAPTSLFGEQRRCRHFQASWRVAPWHQSVVGCSIPVSYRNEAVLAPDYPGWVHVRDVIAPVNRRPLVTQGQGYDAAGWWDGHGVRQHPETRRSGHTSLLCPTRTQQPGQQTARQDIIADLGRLFQMDEETSHSMSSERDASITCWRSRTIIFGALDCGQWLNV